MNDELIAKLQHQSTWLLFFLGAITLGVYWAYYLKRQTRILNEYIEESEKIPMGFVLAILVLSYISVLMFVPSIIVHEGHPIVKYNDLLDLVWSIGIIVWGFKARNRMNSLLSDSETKKYWFSGLWTLIFSPLYFNYKVNKIESELTEERGNA